MDITMNTLEQMESFMDNIVFRCRDIIRWKSENDPNKVIWKQQYIKDELPINVHFINGHISFEMQETWSFGGSETHYYRLPFSEIINDSYQEAFLKTVEEAELKKQKEAEENKRKEAERKEEHDKTLYESLKRKYENK